jgi:ABC-2 type transporter
MKAKSVDRLFHLQLHAILLITKLDIKNWARSRFSVITYAANLIMMPLATGLFGIFGAQISNGLNQYRTDFFGWVSAAVVLQLATFQLGSSIASAMASTNLLFIPLNRKAFFLGKILWPLSLSVGSSTVYLLVAMSLFRLPLRLNPATAAIALLYMLLLQTGMEFFGAGHKMVHRSGLHPLTWSINLLAGFFSGISYPIAILPGSLRVISYVLPQTYAYYFWRIGVTRGTDSNISNPSSDLLVGSETLLPFYPALLGLVILSTVTFLFGLRYLRRCIHTAKKNGMIQNVF